MTSSFNDGPPMLKSGNPGPPRINSSNIIQTTDASADLEAGMLRDRTDDIDVHDVEDPSASKKANIR